MVYSMNSVCFRGSTFDAVVFHLEMCTISMVMASKLPQEKFFSKKKKKKKKKVAKCTFSVSNVSMYQTLSCGKGLVL